MKNCDSWQFTRIFNLISEQRETEGGPSNNYWHFELFLRHISLRKREIVPFYSWFAERVHSRKR
jgi:hypothetical protein